MNNLYTIEQSIVDSDGNTIKDIGVTHCAETESDLHRS